MGKLLLKRFINVYKGWKIWKKINRNPNIRNTEVMLFPSKEMAVNYYGLAYLDNYLRSIKRRDAVVITVDDIVEEVADLFSSNIIEKVKITYEDAQNLMRLYCLYPFTKNLTIVSIDEPHGRNGRALIGKNDTTIEDILVMGIYKLIPNEEIKHREYLGTKENIIEFLNIGMK